LSSKTNISFQVISRGFGVYVSFASSLVMFAGFFIGVYQASPSDTGHFGVLIVLLTAMSDYLQYFLKQIITVESIMLSCERAMKIINLPAEAPFTNEYDEKIGIVDTNKEEAK
jgi:ATP-binding cassette subfamily C (CFTR/MRP) protein 4